MDMRDYLSIKRYIKRGDNSKNAKLKKKPNNKNPLLSLKKLKTPQN
ncbi:hypothetical protein HMPREF1409_00561 [Helicobacter pylori GAM246Ai]|nr:hypothetical protein HMPREF1409_00561 [Helicobacter pylori GAM246Ai]EMH23784.1 hypothetical protein HMPREF1419_01013 [Helicobacter pylori GAM263BFi]EMH34895.1 hypothetical protein HMPREF1424_00235 [Helicobacter pylori GAM42Ai]